VEEIVEKEKKTILVVDDEQSIMELLVFNLQKEGYKTLEAYDGVTAVEMAINEKPDLILLDVMIPKLDGISVCKKIRYALNISNIPILMISAKDTESDKIVGLEMGADDYITKPYQPNILLLRIGAVLKRASLGSSIMDYKGLKVNTSKGIITSGSEEIVLTKNEMIIFYYLLRNQNRIVERDELMTDLWNNNEYINDNALTVNISRLRAKLKELGYDDAIQTRKGIGYILS